VCLNDDEGGHGEVLVHILIFFKEGNKERREFLDLLIKVDSVKGTRYYKFIFFGLLTLDNKSIFDNY